MAITQPTLIGWQAVDASSDLEMIGRVLDNLDDEPLMEALEGQRKGRRDDYPIRAVWNTLVAGFLLGHPTMEGFLRELRRNAELRQLLGYDPLRGSAAVPTGPVISRLLAKLIRHQDLVEAIFKRLVARMFDLLPDFGRNLLVDGKAIKSSMTKDKEAAVGTKQTTDEMGIIVVRWFGFKIHCLCDAATELPIAFRVTAAAVAESPQLIPLVEQAKEEQPRLESRAETLASDKGYDDGADKVSLFIDHGILPIIPSRDLQNGEYRPLLEGKRDTIYTSPSGEICCYIDPANKNPNKRFIPMEYHGFEPDREAGRFGCPAAAFGIECKNRHNCQSATKDQGSGRVVRVKIDTNPRVHLPVYQHSRRFAQLYSARTGIERLFYRLDHMFGMETPLRSTGLAKATLRVTLAMSAMMATALGWLIEQRPDMIRSRLQSAAA